MGCGFAPKFLAPHPITALQLSDAARTSSSPTILVTLRSAPPWLSLIWKIPWVNGLFAAPQPIELDGIATYRLQLIPHANGCQNVCVDAELVDAIAP
jgi:hypothetical protein